MARRKRRPPFKKTPWRFNQNAVAFKKNAEGLQNTSTHTPRKIKGMKDEITTFYSYSITQRTNEALFPLMSIGTFPADFRLHLSSTRTVKSSNICFFLRLGLHLVLFWFRSTSLLEDHTFCHYLFYIHNYSNSISSTSSAEANSLINSTI